ncbi:Ig-like domain-containing protein [Corallococcus exercitus]|uniref:Ig-like domain-containing protein n=1 Tax=Corallococcus exercitus TaxID=2316736 RepID=UPI0035D4AFCA
MRNRLFWGLSLTGLLLSCGAPEGDDLGPELAQTSQPLAFASYDSTLQVPACPGTEACATYDELRGSGYGELHAPNTLNASCADTQGYSYLGGDQIIALSIEPTSGSSFFEKGQTVKVTADAWVTGWGMGYDKVELYHTANITNPQWTLLKTVTPATTNIVPVSATFVLPLGAQQAVRARMRVAGMGTAGPCGSNSDHDDLVFGVSPGDITPPTVSITQPAPGGGVGGTYAILEASATDVGGSVTKVEFFVDGTRVATDTTPYPVASVTWDARFHTPGSHTLTAKAYDSANNVGTSAPVVFTVLPDTTPPSVYLTAPAQGATVSSVVTFAGSVWDEYGIAQERGYYVDGTLVANQAMPKWDSTALPNGTYTVELRGYDVSGNMGVSSPVTVTIANGPELARYDATLKAPLCDTVRAVCDSGGLTAGRGTLGSEFHQPNTVDGCVDGSLGAYQQSASVEQVRISSLDGSPLTVGRPARVDVRVWGPIYGGVGIFISPSASAPVWRRVALMDMTSSGAQTLTAQFVLPAGQQQVLRVHAGDAGGASCYTSNYYDDHDDLVLTVADGPPDTTPPVFTSVSPTEGSAVAGNVIVGVQVTDDTMVGSVAFYDGAMLLGTKYAPPYQVIWNASTATPGPHVLKFKAVDGAGNETTVQRTVFIPDTTPPTVALTSPTAGSTVRGRLGVQTSAQDAGGVKKVELYVDGVLAGNSTGSSPYPTTFNTSVTWDSQTVADGSHTLTIKAYDGTDNTTLSTAIPVTVNNVGMARYDAVLKVPACDTPSDRCESGFLLNGHGTVGPERNAPNTLDACPDSNFGGYYGNGSNEALLVRSLDGQWLEAGKSVRVEARVFVSNTAGSEKLELYSAPDATAPVWTRVATVLPTASGLQTLTATYTLPTGTRQALRARYYFANTANLPCGGNTVYDDHDDLVFPVQPSAPDTTPPTVVLTSPAQGGTVAGTVTLSATATDNRTVERVEFSVDGVLLGTDTTSPYAVAWNTTGLTGSHTVSVRAWDPAGNASTPATATVTVTSLISATAAYDATLKAPKCTGRFNRCDSGTLLNGRGGLGPELNAPNTLNNSCADGTAGGYHSDESSDAITVSTLDGTAIAPGKTVRVEVKVWAYSGFSSDKLDLYTAANANAPSWVFLGTLAPTVAGSQTLSTTFTLPQGTLQAVRANFRYGGAPSPCSTGGYDDHDDLVFAVEP